MLADGRIWSYSWKRRFRSRQYSDHVLRALVYRSRAIGNRVHSGPKSARHGARHSTMVKKRGSTSHSTRTW